MLDPGGTSTHVQSLGGTWQLAPSVSEAWRFRGLHRDAPQPVGAFARTAWIDATVPGSVHHDLVRAGLIPDPNVGLNSLAGEWVSARQWVYRRAFRVGLPEGGRLHLVLGGVDYDADVYLDGEHLGRASGTHTPARFDVSDLTRDEEHLLVVVLREPPAEHGQLGRTSETRSLKPRFGYWWDFATRLVHVGILGAVTLERDEGSCVLDAFAHVTLGSDLAHAVVHARVDVNGDAPLVRATLTHPDGTRETREGHPDTLRFDVARPALWWPARYGAQPLYELHVDVSGSRGVTRRFGIRSVQLQHNEASAVRGARPYTLVINGRPVYARGFNVVPTDMMLARPGVAERERLLVRAARDAHANLLRFNGVAPVASRAALNACDELGVLVWQEMPLTSSGTDNVPPGGAAFTAELETHVPFLLRHVRNHPSVVLLGGGNELTDETRRPVDETHPTVARLRELAEELDGTRPFLPTSPSGPTYDLDVTVAQERPQDLHDVHGPWHHRGVHDSYRPHAVNRALLHSEFGCQGPARESTLARYLTDGPAWPMDDSNAQVVHHGEWWLMRHRVEEVFGTVRDLRAYVLLGQAAQGDVIRHALAWNRSRRGECSGALVWQLNEPWPNAHNTSVIDYDLKPKLAYYRAREANAPHAVHLGLPSPVTTGNVTLNPQVLADASGRGTLRFVLHDLRARVHECALPVEWPAPPTPLALPCPGGPALLRATLHDEHGAELARTEQWIARDEPEPFAPLARAEQTALHARQAGHVLLVRNAGGTPAPWVSIEAPSGVLEDFDDNGFTLLPGEERGVAARLTDASGAAVAAALRVHAVNTPPITVNWRPA